MKRDELLAALPQALLPWYAEHKRDLPWRRDHDPYRVWLSEIMLQQTRVEAVIAYYGRFLAALPDLAALAACPEQQLLKLWEGLGYYRRAHHLQRAAQQIMQQHGGVFPQDYAAIRALPGIGDYTAGAISSICFGAARPAVDGNVLRLLSRILNDDSCVDSPAYKKQLTAELAAVYPAGQAGDFCQSLMELGATVCLPHGAPLCAHCPTQSFCQARQLGRAQELPVRAPKKARRQEQLTVLVLRAQGRLALRQRPERGLLAGLWELPHLPGHLAPQEVRQAAVSWGLEPRHITATGDYRHIFTHIEWQMRGYTLHCTAPGGNFTWVDEAQLQGEYALPVAFSKILAD